MAGLSCKKIEFLTYSFILLVVSAKCINEVPSVLICSCIIQEKFVQSYVKLHEPSIRYNAVFGNHENTVEILIKFWNTLSQQLQLPQLVLSFNKCYPLQSLAYNMKSEFHWTCFLWTKEIQVRWVDSLNNVIIYRVPMSATCVVAMPTEA